LTADVLDVRKHNMSECCKTSVTKLKLLMVHVMFAIQKYKDEDIYNYNFAIVLYGCETWSHTG